MTSRMMLALCSPNANSSTLRASKIVPSPIVMACVGTFHSPKKSLASARRVTGSSVHSRVRPLMPGNGSLLPICPLPPMPRSKHIDAAGPLDLRFEFPAMRLDLAQRQAPSGICTCPAGMLT